MSQRRLEGKVAIITGGASGIGAEAARLFTEHGARVVIVDVQDDLGRDVSALIGEDRAAYYHCDVRNEMQFENAVNFTVQKYGKLDVLFSNAGVIESPVSILDINLDELDRTIAVNLRGAAVTIKHAARSMVASGTRGSIICTTSVAAVIGGTGPHGYTASKHALVGLVKSTSGELGKHGIRVNGVAPYGVGTPLVCNAYGMEPRQVEENSCATANLKGVVLKTHHVAEAALFLASDESVYISGHNLVVDGGYSAVKP